jgi:hypothetical protein
MYKTIATAKAPTVPTAASQSGAEPQLILEHPLTMPTMVPAVGYVAGNFARVVATLLARGGDLCDLLGAVVALTLNGGCLREDFLYWLKRAPSARDRRSCGQRYAPSSPHLPADTQRRPAVKPVR